MFDPDPFLKANKIYACYDILSVEDTDTFLSYLLQEETHWTQVQSLISAGYLLSWRDGVYNLQEVTVKNKEIVSLGKYREDKEVMLFPNVDYGIKYNSDFAYFIKDSKGNTYTASYKGKVVQPDVERFNLHDLYIKVKDLINFANIVNENNNKDIIKKPIPPNRIAFNCSDRDSQNIEKHYLINLHNREEINDPLGKNIISDRGLTKDTLLTVIGMLTERLINKHKVYQNNHLSQSRIINDFLERYSDIRSLGKRNLDQIFAEANAALKNQNR